MRRGNWAPRRSCANRSTWTSLRARDPARRLPAARGHVPDQRVMTHGAGDRGRFLS